MKVCIIEKHKNDTKEMCLCVCTCACVCERERYVWKIVSKWKTWKESIFNHTLNKKRLRFFFM